jgi:hypothetical protein
MDIGPKGASIGYKFHTDHMKDPPHQLTDESEYSAMMQEMVWKVLAVRTRNPVLLLHNLVGHCHLVRNVVFLYIFSQCPVTHTPLSKRK